MTDLFAAMEATWPPASRRALGPFTLRDGADGGQRVCAATVAGAFGDAELDAAIRAMAAPIFQIGPGAGALDAALAGRGWRLHDPVSVYIAPVAALAGPVAPGTVFPIWPPLAIQRDLWAAGGIGPGRMAVMDRVQGAKTALLARAGDRAAGVAFVAVADGIAVLHALHVAPDSRRQGTGRHLMRAAAAWAGTQGADRLALAVTRGNAAGNGLYASLGMEIVEQYHYRIPKEPPR